VLNVLAQVLLGQGDLQDGLAAEEESILLCEELGDRRDLGYSLSVFALLRLARGEAGAAHQHLAQTLQIFKELGDRWGALGAISGVAALAAREAHTELALQLAAAAEAQRQAIGGVAPVVLLKMLQDELERAGRTLDPSLAGAALARGSALSFDQALAQALEYATGAPQL
jgi:hypothetical protein